MVSPVSSQPLLYPSNAKKPSSEQDASAKTSVATDVATDVSSNVATDAGSGNCADSTQAADQSANTNAGVNTATFDFTLMLLEQDSSKNKDFASPFQTSSTQDVQSEKDIATDSNNGWSGIQSMLDGSITSLQQQLGLTVTPSANNSSVNFNQADFVNFLLAGSKGGTSGTSESIEGRFAQAGSRFARSGANEFDAATQHMYVQQFKAFSKGLQAAYTPGSNIQAIAANLDKMEGTQFTPEAELFANVAATYRGDLAGVGKYDNKKLQGLLVQWGRTDLANQAGVGQFDVHSIGSVVRALNEEPDAAKRKAWLQQIYDFSGNTPKSPSGAVPDVAKYQKAVSIVKSGALDKLLQNYQNGVQTSGPINIPTTTTTNTTDPNSLDFRKLTTDQRTAMGLNDKDRAVLHLWGRQMITTGYQDGSILNTVLNAAAKGDTNNTSVLVKPAEVTLAQELQKRDIEKYGGITGKALDEEFFKVFQKITGKDIASRYADSSVRYANGKEAKLPDATLDSEEWETKLEAQNGLNEFENDVLRLWGHEPLFNGGKIDGSIAALTLKNPNSLDKGMDKSIAQILLQADLGIDGKRNGDSLRLAFDDVMDKLYGVDPSGTSIDKIKAQTWEKATNAGRSITDVLTDMTTGVKQAMGDVFDFATDHPVMTAAAAGGLLAAGAVCPFLGGLGAGAAGLAMASNKN